MSPFFLLLLGFLSKPLTDRRLLIPFWVLEKIQILDNRQVLDSRLNGYLLVGSGEEIQYSCSHSKSHPCILLFCSMFYPTAIAIKWHLLYDRFKLGEVFDLFLAHLSVNAIFKPIRFHVKETSFKVISNPCTVNKDWWFVSTHLFTCLENLHPLSLCWPFTSAPHQ